MNPTRILLTALVLGPGVPLLAQDEVPLIDDRPPVEQRAFALTIYSTADPAGFDPKQYAQQRRMNPYHPHPLPGWGVVRETRSIELNEGSNTIRFTDVAAGIDPTTVSFKSLLAPETTAVLEQSYEYDLVSAEKLLEKYLGREVVVYRRMQQDAPPAPMRGTLLSYDGGTLVLREEEEGSVKLLSRGGDVTGIELAELSSGLITKPTLVWLVEAQKAGRHQAQVTYQTSGLTWRADYNLIVSANDTAADIGAWVTILNESGASYPQAKLKLVAGDVQRVQPEQRMYREMEMAASRAALADEVGFKEKAFFEYHLYTLGRPTSLSNNATKQIELFPTRSGVPVNKTFVYYGLPEQFRFWHYGSPYTDRNLGADSNKRVDVYLLLENKEQNGMGIPLPAGRLRVYKRDDADGSLEFIGEDVIQHTPKNEQVMVKLGSAFDIVGERKQTNFTTAANGRVITESFEIKLRNHKAEPVKVIVKENLYRWSNWEITHASHEHQKQDHRTIHFPVEVPADGETVVTYTVRYTW